MILRGDSRALVIQHRFGVVRVPFSEISAASRTKFNPEAAKESMQRRRAEERRFAAERSHTVGQEVRQERDDLRRAGVEVDEHDQANAEGLEETIRSHKGKRSHSEHPSQRLRLRGEVIGVGPDWVLVLCEAGNQANYVRRELAHLPNSPFAPPHPAAQEVLALTGLRQAVAEGESVDLPVEEIGMRSDLRTKAGDNYSGKYRLFRAVD